MFEKVFKPLADAIDALAEKYAERDRKKKERELHDAAWRIMGEFFAAPGELEAPKAWKAEHMPVGGGR